MDRRQKAAGGGGKGVSVPAFAFLCQVCGMGFNYIDELQIHQMTEHASDADLANDDTQPGLPQSFAGNPVYGPIQSDFTPYDTAKIQQMLIQHIGGPEEVKIPEIPPPLAPTSPDFFGFYRGIAGKTNSCLYDVFFMLLAFSTAFDGIFTQKALDESIFLRIIFFEIVIPLRTRMFVNRDIVAMLRSFLADATRSKAYLSDTFDFTEFLMDLLKQVDFSMVCNFAGESITCGLVLEIRGIEGQCSSLQELIYNTLRVDNIIFKRDPNTFIARVRPDLITAPPHCLPQSSVLLGKSTYLPSAILCMSRSHYTAFYRLQNGEWVFFDCMRDKDHGHCIPSITHVPGFQKYLDSGCNEENLGLKSDGESRDLFDIRIKLGAYAYVYTVVPPHQSSSARCGGVAAVPAQPSPSSRKSSVGGGAAAVPAQPAQSSRKPSASGGGAAVSAQPAQSFRKSSASGGGAAAIPHQSSPSFGHFQPRQSRFDAPFVIKAESLSDSVFSTSDGFFKTIAKIVENFGNCPQYVKVTGLSIPSASADSIQLYGSFPVCKDDNYYPYRGITFMFDDGSLIRHDDSVDSLSDPKNKTKFSEKLLQHWRNGNLVLSSIQFERCQLKPIPQKK